MKILAFDTATAATTVALADSDSGESIAARDDPQAGERPRHTTQLMALIASVLEQGGCSWEGVDRIAVGIGPGTFTGLRIGVATARALGRARQIPVVGVSTLHSLALGATPQAQADGHGAIVAVLDARRAEVFAAAWTTGQLVRPPFGGMVLRPAAFAPEALQQKAAGLGQSRLAIGDGALAFRAVLEGSGTSIPDERSRLHRVDATHHCRLASGPEPAGRDDVLPEYLRLPDAELAQLTLDKR